MSDPEISTSEKTRKRQFAFLCVALAALIIAGFTIVDIIEGDAVETTINILMGVVLFTGFIVVKRFNADLLVYRLLLATMALIFLYNISIGSGSGTAIYWLFPFPLIFVFLLGKKEGGVFSAIFFCLLCVVLTNPFPLESYPYPVGISLRFLVSLLFVTLLAYGLEASREKYAHLLTQEHTTLLKEKQNLEKALREIKTLSGLIPICSNCKKIRNDKGYWQQVETYMRDHSTADFSHSICPECFKKLYPGYEYPES